MSLILAIIALVLLFACPRWLRSTSGGERRRLWHVGVHTEYLGTGRVRFISFFRGPGYCLVLRRGRGRDGRPLEEKGWRPNIEIRGFAIYWRTAKSSRPSSYGKPVKHFRITANGNSAKV